jgi:hypothetical protein
MQFARRKLGKKSTSQSWGPPLPYGRHGALPVALPHTTISQHAAQHVNVVKTREYYCFTIIFISYFKAQRIADVPCLCVCRLHQRVALRVSYSQQAALRISYSQWVALRV